VATARILAVDDQRYFRELLEGMLVEEGYAVRTAASAEEALRLLEQSVFDVVLTDLLMPGMDGSELVHRIKERLPSQEVVVVTGVVDVKTAVDAMKLGATDYLLKPFERKTLVACLEGVLQRQRLRDENERLLSENIEYLGVLSLMERALELFACLSLEALAERIAEGVCVEAEAQGGVLWTAPPGEEEPERLVLAAARGLVRAADEAEGFTVASLPAALRDGSRLWVESGPTEALPCAATHGTALFLPLRHDGRLVGLLRLTDRLGSDAFDDEDRAAAVKLVRFASVALANALRFRALEERSLRDPHTEAYRHEYLRDAVRAEIEKSGRTGRGFSLLRVELAPLDGLRVHLGEEEMEAWLKAAVRTLAPLLRASDLLAADGRGIYTALLPETDALAAATLKLRVRESLEASDLLASLDPEMRPGAFLATVAYPADGTQQEALERTLSGGVAEDRRSPVRALDLPARPLEEGLRALLEEEGRPTAPDVVRGIARFAVEQVRRRPGERTRLFLRPEGPLAGPVREALAGLRGVAAAGEVVVVSDGDRLDLAEAPITWVSTARAPGSLAFAIRCGEGPAYALVCDDKEGEEGWRVFQTGDRGLVEYLALRLARELQLPGTDPAAESAS